MTHYRSHPTALEPNFKCVCTIKPSALRDEGYVRFTPIAIKLVRQRNMSRWANKRRKAPQQIAMRSIGLAAKFAHRCTDHRRQGRHGVGLLQPPERGGGLCSQARIVTGMGARENAADSMR